jgi:hypothetical protein
MAVIHSNLSTHSAPFALPSGYHQVFITGTVADGSDMPRLQQQVGGGYRDLDPAMTFNKLEVGGGCKLTKMLPAGLYRWSVPGSFHNISTNVTKV